MKNKKAEPKQITLVGQPLVLHDGNLYLSYLADFKKSLAGDDGVEPLSQIPRVSVAVAKKVIKTFEGIMKDRKSFGEEKVFENTPFIDEDGDLTIGCTYISLKEAQDFLKKLA